MSQTILIFLIFGFMANECTATKSVKKIFELLEEPEDNLETVDQLM